MTSWLCSLAPSVPTASSTPWWMVATASTPAPHPRLRSSRTVRCSVELIHGAGIAVRCPPRLASHEVSRFGSLLLQTIRVEVRVGEVRRQLDLLEQVVFHFLTARVHGG